MSDAVAAIGATITIDSTPIAEVRDISGPEFSTDEVDVTSHDSPGFGEEVLPTIKRWGAISFPMNLVAGDAGQDALATAWAARSVDTYVVTLTNGASLHLRRLRQQLRRSGCRDRYQHGQRLDPHRLRADDRLG